MGLTKRRDGYYVQFPVRINGAALELAPGSKVLKRWKAGRDRLEAKHQESFWKTQLLMGRVQSEQNRTIADLTFSDWADIYLAMDAVQALRTYQHRKISVERFKILFSNKRLADLSTDDVEQLRAVRRGEGKATSTINNDHAALKHLLSVAVARGKLTVNVASRVPLTNPENERDRVLTVDEWHRLYNSLPDHLKDFVLIAYEVGARRGELRKLCWPQVDVSSRTFKILGVNAKNKRERMVPMTANVHTAFARLANHRLSNSNAVFTYKGQSLSRNAFAWQFNRVVAAAGISDFHYHDLRHCAATNWRRAGVPTSVVMRVMGWRSIKMFQRYDSVKTDDLLQGARQHDNWKPDTLMTLRLNEALPDKTAMSQVLDRPKREMFVIHHAPVAQLDRASGFEPAGRRFNSCRAHHLSTPYVIPRSPARPSVLDLCWPLAADPVPPPRPADSPGNGARSAAPS